jgi:hypothetical protein
MTIDWNQDWTWIEFEWNGDEVSGHLNTLICDGGYYRSDDTFVPFNIPMQKWLENLNANREDY